MYTVLWINIFREIQVAIMVQVSCDSTCFHGLLENVPKQTASQSPRCYQKFWKRISRHLFTSWTLNMPQSTIQSTREPTTKPNYAPWCQYHHASQWCWYRQGHCGYYGTSMMLHQHAPLLWLRYQGAKCSQNSSALVSSDRKPYPLHLAETPSMPSGKLLTGFHMACRIVCTTDV